MGFDFSSHQLFTAARDPRQLRTAAIVELRRILQEEGFREVADETEADRSFVVGPPELWIFIGDSAGSTEWADPAAFEALSRSLSELGPVVDILMSDSAVLHFCLYRNGQRVDKFGNGEFPWFWFKTEEDAAPFRGIAEAWADLLLQPDRVGDLRSKWVQGEAGQASDILESTAELFGWNSELAGLGYTTCDEQTEIKYSELLGTGGFDVGAFAELHFQEGKGNVDRNV
jgi:hypothetical protein